MSVSIGSTLREFGKMYVKLNVMNYSLLMTKKNRMTSGCEIHVINTG